MLNREWSGIYAVIFFKKTLSGAFTDVIQAVRRSSLRRCSLKEEFVLAALLFSMFRWDIGLRSVLRHCQKVVEDVKQTCHKPLLRLIVVQIKSALRDASAALDPSSGLVLSSLKTPPCFGKRAYESNSFRSCKVPPRSLPAIERIILESRLQSVSSTSVLLIPLFRYDWFG